MTASRHEWVIAQSATAPAHLPRAHMTAGLNCPIATSTASLFHQPTHPKSPRPTEPGAPFMTASCHEWVSRKARPPLPNSPRAHMTAGLNCPIATSTASLFHQPTHPKSPRPTEPGAPFMTASCHEWGIAQSATTPTHLHPPPRSQPTTIHKRHPIPSQAIAELHADTSGVLAG